MPQTIDERIVEMRIDNDQFERGAQQTMRTMQKLRESTNFGNFSTDHISQEFEKLSNNIDHSINGLVPNLKRRFFQEIEDSFKGLLSKVGSGLKEFEKQVSALSIGQMEPGWTKLEEKTASVQTLLNSTGLSLEQVNKHLADLMWYSDETSFGFTDMTQALATMTSTGGNIEKLVPMIMGMGNAVAFAGKSAAEFKRVIFNLNQSYSSGALTLLDWRSVQQAGAASKQLTQALIDAGVVIGTIKEGEVTLNNFADSLKKKWATSEVMEKAFGYFGELSVQARQLVEAGDFDNAYEAYDFLAQKFEDVQVSAAKAAQEAKSFSETIAATKDAVSTGWMGIFETVFGDYNQQKDFWSGVTEELYKIFTGPTNRIKEWAQNAFGTKEAVTGWSKFEKQLQDAGTTGAAFIEKLSVVLSDHGRDVDEIIEQYGSLENALQKGAITADEFKEALESLKTSGSEQLAESAEITVETLETRIEKLREIASQVLQGMWGNGQERIDALEAAGYNAELIQRMAEWTHMGNSLDVDYLAREYPTLLAMIRDEITATGTLTAEEIEKVNSLLESSDEYWKRIQAETEEIASALLPNMKKQLRDAEADVLQIQKEIAEKGIDINKTVYGNIDTNNRQILTWTEENLEKYKKELESWGIKAEEVAGEVSTVLGASSEYHGVEIAYSPILQTEHGPELLSKDTVDKYIETLFASIEESGQEWTPELLLEFDTKGFEIDGHLIQGLLADIGSTAIKTGEAMHYVGNSGALAKAKENLETVKNSAKEFLEMTGAEHWQAGLLNILSAFSDILQAIYSGFDMVFGTVEERGSGFRSVLATFHDWTLGLEITDERFSAISKSAAAFFSKIKAGGNVLKTVLQSVRILGIVALQTVGSFTEGLFGKNAISKGIKNVSDETKKLASALPTIETILKTVVSTIITSLPKIKEMAFDIGLSMKVLAAGIMSLIPSLRQAFARGVTDLMNLIAGIFPSFQDKAKSISDWFLERVGDIGDDGERILPKWSTIFDRIRENAGLTASTIGQIFGFEDLDKKIEEFGSKISGVYERVKSFFTGLFPSEEKEKIKEGNSELEKTETLLGKIFKFASDSSFPGLSKIVKADVSGTSSLMPSNEEIDQETQSFWSRLSESLTKNFSGFHVDFSRMFDIGKLGVLAYGLYKLGTMLDSFTSLVNPRKNGLAGIAAALKTTITNIGKPFFAFSKKIETEGRADEMIKLAAAIGILALAMMGLSMIPEQQLFNVAAVMMGVMLVLKLLAGAGQGISIFSNNAKKTVGDMQATFNVLKDVKASFSSADLKEWFHKISLTANVIPPAMGALIGVAALIGTIGAIFIKIRDIKDIHDVLPALQVLGLIAGGIAVLIAEVGALGPRMQGVGGTVIAIGVLFALVGQTIHMLTSIDWSSTSAIVGTVVGGIAVLLIALGLIEIVGKRLEEIGKDSSLSVGKILSFGAAIVAIGIVFTSIATALGVLSNANTEGLFMAALALGTMAVGLKLIIDSIEKVPKETSLIKAAGALMLMALAIDMLVLPLVLIAPLAAFLGPELILTAAGLALFAAGMAVIVGVLSAKGGEQLVSAAESILLASLALVVIAGAITMIGGLDWPQLLASGLALGLLLAEVAAAIGILSKLKDADNMLVAAASLTTASVGLLAIGGALRVIGELDVNSITAAAIAMGILFAVLAAALTGMSFLEHPEKMMTAATAMLIGAAAIDVLALGLAGLSYVLVDFVQNSSWDEIGVKAQEMAAALEPIEPYLIGLGIAMGLLIVIAAAAGDKLGMFGLGIAGVGIGVLAVVGAFALLPQAVHGIIDAIDLLNNNVSKVAEFVMIIGAIALAAFLEYKTHFVRGMIDTVVSCLEVLSNTATLTKIASAIKVIGAFAFAFLMGEMPELMEKMIELIVSFFNNLADAINANAAEIAIAIEKMLIALINVLLQTVIRLLFDAIGWLGDFIVQALKGIGIDLTDVDLFKNLHDMGANVGQRMTEQADYIFEGLNTELEGLSKDTIDSAADTMVSEIENQTPEIGAAAENSIDNLDAQVQAAAAAAGIDAAQAGTGAAASELANGSEDVQNAAAQIGQDSEKALEDSFTGSIYGGNIKDLYSQYLGETGSEANDSFLTSLLSGLPDFASYGSDAAEATTDAMGETLESNASGTLDIIPKEFRDWLSGNGFDLSSIGGNMAGLVTDGAEDTLPEGADEIIELTTEQLEAASKGHEQEFKDIGVLGVSHVKQGYLDEIKVQAPEMVRQTASDLNDAVNNNQEDYKVIGILGVQFLSEGYLNEIAYRTPDMIIGTVDGLSREVFNQQDELRYLGQMMFEWQYEGYRQAADQHSPSRVMEREMGYTIEGLVVGAKENAKKAFNAMHDVGDGMMDAMRNSMSRLSLAVDRDYDLQPRITPVVDLGPASQGVSALRSMVNGRSMSSILESYRAIDGLAISGATLNYTNQNALVTSAIHDLSKRMDRFSKVIDEDRNFNVDIRVDNLAVRDDRDIQAISKQLAREVRVALRQKGTR